MIATRFKRSESVMYLASIVACCETTGQTRKTHALARVTLPAPAVGETETIALRPPFSWSS
jgi:hypothetical protein